MSTLTRDKMTLPSGWVMEIGEDVFVTTGTTLEVPTALKHILVAFALPESYTTSAGAGEQVMFCDKAVTTGAVTFARRAGTESAAKFSYLLIGRQA